MEIMGALVGLVGAGLQAQAQHDNLMFQYAKFNWEKQRANTQDRFAQASRSDQYGNVTGYDPVLNKWDVKLAPTQKEISDAQQKEQLLQLTKDIPAARKVKEAVQKRAYEAREPFNRAAVGYQYDQPPSAEAIQSELAPLLAQSDARRANEQQAGLLRGAIRLGRGEKAANIINASDEKLGDIDTARQRALTARGSALKEFQGRQQLHEQQWGQPMKIWGELMAQGGDMPNIPKGALTDTTGAQQSAMLNAFNQSTGRVGGAFDSLAKAAGQSVDLSGVAKILASIGQRNSKNKSYEDTTQDQYSGTSTYGPATYDDDRVESNSSAFED